jgi:CheY-like chemotaxis protein
MTPRHILIVDDEMIVALGFRSCLERLPDCRIAIVTSGEQALRLFERQPFDLLITDYNLPGIDGVTLAAHVQELYPQTATIMITASNSDTLREQAARVSIRRVLRKPARPAEILRTVLETLSE